MHVGIFLQNPLNKHFAFRHELNYIWKNFGVSLSDSVLGIYDTKLIAHYIELSPITLSFYSKGFSVFAGPYINALVSAHHKRLDSDGKKYKDKTVFGRPDIDESEDKYMQKIDFGFTVGADYQFKCNVVLGLRFSQGAIDIYQYANSYELGDTRHRIKIKNRGLGVFLGYVF